MKTYLRFVFGMLSFALMAGVAWGTTTYYPQGSLAPNTTTNWNTVRAGGGSSPANFTAGDVFVIQNGHNMTTSATWSVSGAGSKVWIESGGKLTATSAVTLNGATTFQIDANGEYVHNNTIAYGGSIFQGTESFDAASTVTLNNSNTTGPSSVTFGNLTVNFTSDPGGSVNLSGGITTINGNFTVQSTSTREFRLTGNTSLTLTISGNLTISGGTLNLASGSGSPTINVGGNFNQSGGTLTSGSSVSTIAFTGGAASVTFDESGTLTNTNINWQIASGKTVANNANFGAGSWVNASRTMTVSGTFQINQGSWTGSSGTWSYGAGSTLIFNNSSGSYGSIDNAHVYWPSSSGPANVTVQGAGGITLGVARTVSGTFQTASGVTNANNLTLNGTAQLNAGGYVTGSPTYGSSSTLKYNTGGTYGRGAEWSSNNPANVQLSNNTTLNYPNGSTAARTMTGNLTIDVGSALYMDYGSPGTNNPFTVGGNLTVNGNLSLGDAVGGDLHLAGNWINNGGTINMNGRAVEFNGSSVQDIGGTAATTFAYLTINNAAGVTLSRNATVSNVLALTNGEVSTGSNTLTISSDQPDAVVIASSNGSVNGTIIRAVAGGSTGTYKFTNNRTYIIPNGSQSGQNVTITSYPNTYPPAGNTAGAIKRYYTITPAGSLTAGTLSMEFVPAENEHSVPLLNLTAWRNSSGTTWVNEGGTYGGSNNVVVGPTSTWSNWAMNDGLIPLPIQLSSFTGVVVNNRVKLDWTTASEVNNFGFYVQKRRAQSGEQWAEIPGSFIVGHGTTSTPQHYTFTDISVFTTSQQYRLKQVDLDQTIHYSEPIQVDRPTDVREVAPRQFTLSQNYPNPFNPSTEIKFSVETNGHASLQLYNALGQNVATLFDDVAEAGYLYKVRFDATSLSSGVYFYRLVSGKQADLKKFVLLK